MGWGLTFLSFLFLFISALVVFFPTMKKHACLITINGEQEPNAIPSPHVGAVTLKKGVR